ncbi:hypothetical protein Tco_0023721, partial [Tanacetum coccineum]
KTVAKLPFVPLRIVQKMSHKGLLTMSVLGDALVFDPNALAFDPYAFAFDPDALAFDLDG